MRNFLNRIGNGMRNFMIGRYGSDDLGRFLVGVLLFLIVISFIVRNPVLQVIIWAVFLYSYFRMLSRNYAKRAAENEWYMQKTAKIRRFFRIRQRRFADRKEYRHFTCPGCGQDIRVPKGKGHIRISCPKCHHTFEKTV
ncbi:MAG TPA: hypothetical protein DCG37_02930 [Lachnospiraceae bacterium]|nr:hypothetical protein [Lachnospiraceae bacterium]